MKSLTTKVTKENTKDSKGSYFAIPIIVNCQLSIVNFHFVSFVRTL